MKTVLLTGGTGTFGRFLVRDLLSQDGVRLILLVRGGSDAEARARVEKHGAIPPHTEVFAADLLQPRLGLSEERYRDLTGRITHILHSAASTRFNSPLEEARRNNVETTKQILAFAKDCGKLVRFGYLSTAFVAGKRIGLIKEDELKHNAGFNNTYQQSKYEAETLVRTSGLPIVIFRPPFVRSVTEAGQLGNSTDFLSRLITLVVAGHIPFVPGTKDSAMDIVNGSDAAGVICQLFLKDNLVHTTYHITNGTGSLTVGTFHRLMEDEKGESIPIEYLGDGDEGMRRVREKAKQNPMLEEVYKRAESFLSEPGYPKIFDNTHTLAELGIQHLGEEPTKILRSIVHNTIALWNSSK